MGTHVNRQKIGAVPTSNSNSCEQTAARNTHLQQQQHTHHNNLIKFCNEIQTAFKDHEILKQEMDDI